MPAPASAASQPDAPGIIISYPKTGRTWLRMLIGRSLCRMNGLPEERVHDTPYLLAASGLPFKAITHGDSSIKLFRHYSELGSDKSGFRDRKVLLLGRDIRDTLVSAYFHVSRRMRVYDGSLSQFVRDEYHGAIKFLTFYRHWYDGRHIPREFMFLRYEDLHGDPAAALTAALAFLGVREVDPSAVGAAVEFASFSNLRKSETESKYKDDALSPRDRSDPESYKFRRGKVAGYADYLSPEDVDYIERLNDTLGCEFTRPNEPS